jgi:hypothetical protein
MNKIRMSLPNRIKSFLYYYFRCFKPKINPKTEPKIDPNLSDYDEDYVEDYVEDYSDSEIVTLINLNN